MAVTLTGDNNFSGVYSNVDVLGGANHGGTTTTDITAGSEVFLFGELSSRSTKIDSGIESSGTWNVTTSGGANDTLIFDFKFTPGTGTTSDFLTSSFALSGGLDNGNQPSLTTDTDGDAQYQSTANVNAWDTQYALWKASLGAGAVFSNPTTIETSVSSGNGHPDPDVNVTLDITGTVGGPPTLTSDHAGAKILLGFAVGSDHLNFNGDSTITDAEFNQFFDVTASSHLSANHNTVDDTVVSLHGGGWSVDLYGVDVDALTTAYNAAHSTTLSTHDYVFDFILSH